MDDPHFANPVILLVRHGKDGAMGIVINRPIGERPISDLVRATGGDASGDTGTIRTFAGGPLQPAVGFVLHDAAYHRADTVDIDGRVAMTSNLQIIHDISQHTGLTKTLLAFGYAGWAPQQREAELAQWAWLTTPEDPRLVFDVDRMKVWGLAMASAEQRR